MAATSPVLLVVGLILIGLVLVAAEILFIPGFGALGILGGGAIVAAGVVAYIQLSPNMAILAIVSGVAATGLLLWLLPKTKIARSMVLEAQQTGTAADPALKELVGQQGRAATVLRPSGSAEIDGRLVDVVTDGQYVEKGTDVRVVRVEGARVLVEPLS